MAMGTVLVTGCAGFIASHLAEALLQRGLDVIGVDNFDPYYSVELKRLNIDSLKQHPHFHFLEGDISNENILGDVFKNDIDVVYHLAASAGVRNSINYPVKYCWNDVYNTVLLLDMVRNKEVRKFVLASSSSVYGEVPESELPMKEDRLLRPISPYALSKQQAEMWCEMFRDVYGLNTVALRYFTVYGPRQRPDEAFTKFISRILKGEEIQIYGDGKQTRDFTFIGDIVKGTMLAAEKGSGIYNLGGGNRVSVNEMVSVIRKATGESPRMVNIEKQQGDVLHTFADITKARKDLGYGPATSLEEGTRMHVEWVRKLRDNGLVFR
jgi:nucleoside-diphosphate-sugar epimerase